jgi:signal transduction histidine kinase
MAQAFAHNLTAIYFVYGLAFFSMGLAILLTSARYRTSELRLAYALWPLALFGIVHGLNEWFEMFQRMDRAGATNLPAWLLSDELRLGHLIVSFLLLIVFGVVLLYVNRRSDGREWYFAILGAGLFLMLWAFSVTLTWTVYQPDEEQQLAVADVLSRYTLAIPGAIIAAWAIWLEQSSFRNRGMPTFGRALLGAAIALLIYGVIGQVFTSPSFLFPSNIINTNLFLNWFGVPVQLLRATTGVLIAFFIIRALNAFGVEAQQRLISANNARLAAQEEATHVQEQARYQTERLNRDLQAAVQDLSLLFYLSRKLAGTLDRRALLEQAMPMLVDALPQIKAGMVLLLPGEGTPGEQPAEIVSIVECDDPAAAVAERKAQGLLLAEAVIAGGHPAWMVDKTIVPLGDEGLPGSDETLSDAPGGHTMAMPLATERGVVGALVVCTLYDAQPFTLRDAALVRSVADQLSIALENATLYEKVEQNNKLRGEFLHRVVSAQEAERKRIARELHDGTGQTLTALGLGLAAAADRVESAPALARQQLLDMKQLNAGALQELHEVIADLRPSLLDNLGLVPALRGQLSLFETRTGIATQLAVHGKSARLKPEVETTVFRVAQESLTNVTRHARAGRVEVDVTFGPELVELIVRDNGCGFDPEAALATRDAGRAAWGLMGIAERASLVGGTSEIRSRPGEGTTVRLTVPDPYPERREDATGPVSRRPATATAVQPPVQEVAHE